jgi:hypothetical protein
MVEDGGSVSNSPGSLSADFSTHTLEKIVAEGECKKKYTTRKCKMCATNKRKGKTRHTCKFYSVAIHKSLKQINTAVFIRKCYRM